MSDVRSVDDAIALVGDLTALTDAPDDTYTICQARRARVPLTGPERRTAFVPIWRRPWMSIASGTYGASLLGLLGIDLVTADLAVPYPTVELEDISVLRPDLVLVPSEPYVFTADHLDELAVAIPGAAIVRIDGQDLFWWGARTPGAIERLAATL